MISNNLLLVKSFCSFLFTTVYEYVVEDRKTDITVHIYNKPKNKKASKLLIQGGSKALICVFVFTVLPIIYKTVCENKSNMIDSQEQTTTKSMVKCGQCRVKATMTGMKMHLRTAHSNAKPQVKTRNAVKTPIEKTTKVFFKCDNCEYKSEDRAVLMQHIEGIHIFPWRLRMETSKSKQVQCERCEFVTSDKATLEHHSKDKHESGKEVSEPFVELNIENDDARDNNITLEEASHIDGYVDERKCPTPIPEQVYICGECNLGAESEEEVKDHMKINHHKDNKLEENLKRLESELRFEREQHNDHKDMLEVSLKEISSLKQYIVELEQMKQNLENQIGYLKKDIDENVLKQENKLLKDFIDEKEKQQKKNAEKHKEEVAELKRNQMFTSENLSSTVKEREILRENDRILLNTLDMMKKYGSS